VTGTCDRRVLDAIALPMVVACNSVTAEGLSTVIVAASSGPAWAASASSNGMSSAPT
jgi:hypothetical protein